MRAKPAVVKGAPATAQSLRRSSFGSLAKFAAMRRASSRVSRFIAMRWPRESSWGRYQRQLPVTSAR
jgi:hypothetical protein